MPLRIAKRDNAEANDHRDDRVTAVYNAHAVPRRHRTHCQAVGCSVNARLQLVRKHVEQHLGIRIRGQVAPVLANQQSPASSS